MVVSNTSPLNYLLLIGEIDLLPRLYTQIWVPPAVLAEVNALDAPPANRLWASAPPNWLKTREPSEILPDMSLHVGETHAISLALELKADRLILDDFAGRQAAQTLGLPIVGTLGLLDLAAERGLVDLPHALNRLAATNFRVAKDLIDELLLRDSMRRRNFR